MSGTRSRSPRRSSTTPRRGAPLTRGLAILALLLGVLGQESGKAADDLTDALPVLAQLHRHGRLRGRQRRPSTVATDATDSRPAPFTWAPRPSGSSRRTRRSSRRSSTGKRSPKQTEDLGGVLFRGTAGVVRAHASRGRSTGVFAPCWSRSGNTLYAMRADVLSLLPPQLDESGNPTGRRLVNDVDLLAATYLPENARLHTVTLPERGVGNQTPQSAGASLFVVFRDVSGDSGAEAHRRLRRRPRAGQGCARRSRRFAASCSRRGGAAKVTQIISRGAANATDQVTFAGAGVNTVAGNLFAGSPSPDSDRSLDPLDDRRHAPRCPAWMPASTAKQLTMTSRYSDPGHRMGARPGRRSRSARPSRTPTTTGSSISLETPTP